MSELEVCGKWMPRAKTSCAKKRGHSDCCLSEAALSRHRKSQVSARDSRREKRYALISEYKVQKGCSRCGYNKDPRALDLDHVSGIKKAGISQLVANNSWETVLEELKKCVVLCANCHRAKTFAKTPEVGISNS